MTMIINIRKISSLTVLGLVSDTNLTKDRIAKIGESDYNCLKTMENSSSVIESQYPITFREDDAKALGKHLKNRNSIVLIGMKRVGISNFLRFFLHHKSIVGTYIGDSKKHVFISVDLNDLIERELFAFWTLTLKRIVDAVEKSSLGTAVKKKLEGLFFESVQTQDLFLKIDNIRRALVLLVENNIMPTLFFLRFDRLKDVVKPEFFANLQGLKDATHQKVSYVFTSFRSLDKLSPNVFTPQSLSVFSHDMYIAPAKKQDTEIIYNTYKDYYHLRLSSVVEEALFDSVDGYVQYLQLALIALHEQKNALKTKEELFSCLTADERIHLQSEELWESLEQKERSALLKVYKTEAVGEEERKKAKYLWDTGFISQNNIFSPLFEQYLKCQLNTEKGDKTNIEFTKKEHLLFSLLSQHENGICEREKIIESVWPEVEALGVSDWAIDRLVARVRGKLKLQKSPFEIQTVKTRGYKLITS